MLPLPLNECGPRIIVHRANFCIQKHSVIEVLQPFNALHEVLILNDPYACINGVMYIMDMTKVTASKIMQFTPSLMKREAVYFEKSMPLRIKLLCFINVSAVAENFIKILLPMLSTKLRQRVSRSLLIGGKIISN